MENWANTIGGTVPSGAYSTQTDQIDEGGWNDILQKFDDANLMQTWSYGSVRGGRNNLSHIVLPKNRELVAAAQIVIKTIPFLGAGIAYVKLGPPWQLRGAKKNPRYFSRYFESCVGSM